GADGVLLGRRPGREAELGSVVDHPRQPADEVPDDVPGAPLLHGGGRVPVDDSAGDLAEPCGDHAVLLGGRELRERGAHRPASAASSASSAAYPSCTPTSMPEASICPRVSKEPNSDVA